VFGVAFSADGKRVFSGGRDKEIHAWQGKDAKKLYEIRGFEGDVLRVFAQSNQLFSCGADKQVRLHQPGDKKAELLRTYSGHRDVVYAVAFHERTGRLASGSFDGEVRVWDAETGAAVTNFIAAPGYRASP
jgi:WD40 repeat protein